MWGLEPSRHSPQTPPTLKERKKNNCKHVCPGRVFMFTAANVYETVALVKVALFSSPSDFIFYDSQLWTSWIQNALSFAFYSEIPPNNSGISETKPAREPSSLCVLTVQRPSCHWPASALPLDPFAFNLPPPGTRKHGVNLDPLGAFPLFSVPTMRPLKRWWPLKSRMLQQDHIKRGVWSCLISERGKICAIREIRRVTHSLCLFNLWKETFNS